MRTGPTGEERLRQGEWDEGGPIRTLLPIYVINDSASTIGDPEAILASRLFSSNKVRDPEASLASRLFSSNKVRPILGALLSHAKLFVARLRI